MSKEAGRTTTAVRVPLSRGSARIRPAWLASRTIVTIVATLVAALIITLYLMLRGSGSFARRKLASPPLPQLNAAIAAAQEKLRANPQDISTLVELGTLHFERGKEFYADAINELEEARELGALDPRIFYCLGVMYQEVGLYTFALEEYKRFLRHYPDDKEIRLLAAKLLYKQGSFAEAVSEYERLRYHYPGDSLIEENLGLSLWGAKNLDRAVESFMQLRQMGNQQGKRAAYYLGQIAFERNDLNGAREHLESARPAAGESYGIARERPLALLGMTYQKLARWPEAKDAWEAVLAETPGDSKAKAALREIRRRMPKHTAKKG